MTLRQLLVSVVSIWLLPPALVVGDGQLRPANSVAELKSWLENMVWYHRYTTDEIRRVIGLSEEELDGRLREFGIESGTRPQPTADRLLVLSYPGGRHPRIGFLDGAINPQRETKLSVFCPWDDRSYVVLDFPEAVWSSLGLTYLAHTHIPTIWTKQGVELPQLEWEKQEECYVMQRTLPNGISFGTEVVPETNYLRMKMWLTNGTDQLLSDLRVQNCVMLKAAAGFADQTNENKIFERDYVAVHSRDRTRWIICAWDPVQRAWGNERCPCLHSDPQFPHCAPGETKWLRGWFSFYQGGDLRDELDRIEATGWRTRGLDNKSETP